MSISSRKREKEKGDTGFRPKVQSGGPFSVLKSSLSSAFKYLTNLTVIPIEHKEPIPAVTASIPATPLVATEPRKTTLKLKYAITDNYKTFGKLKKSHGKKTKKNGSHEEKAKDSPDKAVKKPNSQDKKAKGSSHTRTIYLLKKDDELNSSDRYLGKFSDEIDPRDQPNIVCHEVGALEFCRMLTGFHPESNSLVALAKDKKGEREPGAGTLSKIIPNVTQLSKYPPDVIRKNIISGEWYGLAAGIILGIMTQDRDLRDANFVVDHAGNLVNVDGDRAFAKLRPSPFVGNYDFDILSLRGKVGLYKPKNFFGLILSGNPKPANPENLLTPEVTDSGAFINEGNEWMLINLVLPPELVRASFVNSIEDEGYAIKLADIVVANHRRLFEVAFDSNFIAYVKTDAARELVERLKIRLQKHVALSGTLLWQELPNLNAAINNHYAAVFKKALTAKSEPKPYETALQDRSISVEPKPYDAAILDPIVEPTDSKYDGHETPPPEWSPPVSKSFNFSGPT